MTTVLKLGGELLENAAAMQAMAAAIRTMASREQVVVIHGGGRTIDAELRARGLEPKFVDGLRITDAAALETVVSVLAGRTNTAFIGALHGCGVRAVGLRHRRRQDRHPRRAHRRTRAFRKAPRSGRAPVVR